MSQAQTSSPGKERPPCLDDLRQQLHQRLDEIIDAELALPADRSFLELEKGLRQRLLGLAALLLQLLLLARHQRLDLSSWLARGYRVADDYAQRTLQTTFGAVRYGRAYLIPKRGGPGVHPLDAQLGLTRDSHSPLLIGFFCRLATRLSYRLAAQMGGMFLGAAPSPNTIEEWVLGLGRPAYVYLSDGPLPEGDGEVLVIEIDGKAAPTATEEELAKRRGKRQKHAKACDCQGCQRHRGRQRRQSRGKKKRRKPGDKSKNGRSVTLVAMYTLQRGKDGRLHGPINKKIYGSFGCRHAAVLWARQQATRRGFPPDTTKTVQIVLDGEICLEQRMRQQFPQAIVTLDIRHAQEKLWTAGRQVYREGSAELAAWVGDLEKLLYQGKAEALLASLRWAQTRLSQHGPGTLVKRLTLQEIIDYFQPRVELMRYGQWRKQDLVIASGVVEGAARYVVGERLDQSGMRWVEERAECLLLLRCIEVNGDWDSFWDSAQRQRSADLRNAKVLQIRSKVPTQLPVDDIPEAA